MKRLSRHSWWAVCACAIVVGCGSPPTPTDQGMPHPTVALTPSTAMLNPGQQQTFVATVTGSDDTAVMWSVQEASGGSITGGGVYTAPSTPGSYTVVATSHADPSAQGTATVLVVAAPQIAVSVSPLDTSVTVGGTRMFTASLQNASDTSVTWTVMEAGGGTIAADGTYTAPSTTGTYHVIATSHQDPTKMAAATVHVTVGVTVMPATATLNAGQQQTFFATVAGSSNQGVTWTVMEGGGGTVAPDGAYTAPSMNGTYHVVATSVADATVSATATVTVTSTPQLAVTLSPPAATLDEGAQQLIQATVTNAGGGSTAVTWKVIETGGGTVASDGTYTAPFQGGVYHVMATSVADPSKTAVAKMTVTPATLTLDVTSTTLDEGQALQLNATLHHITDPAVDWSVMEVAGGSVTSAGLYTAPIHSGTFHVIAKSHSDPNATATATITVRSISVTVQPTTITLDQGAQHTFGVTVTGAADATVTWTATGGTIDMTTGAYTAPKQAGSYTITATSNADGTTQGTCLVTVSPIVVTLSPPGPLTLDQGAQQQFTVTVTGSVDQSFHYTVDCGSIDANGLYTAPMNQAAAQTCKVVATSNSDTTVAAKTTINVNALTLAITEPSLTLDQGAQHAFAVNIAGIANKNVTWSATCSPAGTGGGINPGTGVFLAPSVAGGGSSCSIQAQAADGVLSIASTVTVSPVQIAVAPGTATVAPNQSAGFVATVTGSVNHNVTWSVIEASGGTISPSGVYFAPGATGSYTVQAVAAADPTRSATGAVTVTTTVAVSVSPGTVTLGTGQPQAFAATVTGSANTAVAWSTSAGSITPTGVLTAPGSAGTVTVTATSLADNSKTGTATVTVVATPQITVSVSPPSVTLNPGVGQTFAATVTNTTNQAVTWSLAEGAAGGTIDAAGVYTPPVAAGTYHVIATSAQDPTRIGVATVNVTTGAPVSVSVSPPSAILTANQTQPFGATVTGSSNTAVSWSLGAGSVGSIDPVSGVYTAPNSASGSATVIATSAADATKHAQAQVTLTGTVNVTVNPPSTTVAINATQQFTATVTGSAVTSVTWGVTCSSGGTVDGNGVFTAPGTAQSCTVTATGAGGAQGSAQVTVVAPGTYSVSGTVSYQGTPRTGSVFLVAYDQGGAIAGGTHIGAPGPFTVRGLRQNGAYHLKAWDDASGGEIQLNLAADQNADVALPMITGDLTGVSVSLADPTPVAITVAPGILATFPGVGGLGINYNALRNSSGDELADHYTVYVSTSPTPGPTDNLMVRRVGWWSDHQTIMLTPLAAGSYYLAIRAGNSLGEGPLSAPLGPIAVGQAPTGGHTVKGTFKIPAAVVPTGPLTLALAANSQGGPPTSFTGIMIANPGASNDYVLTGVPDGPLTFHALLDQRGDGQLGLEDHEFETNVTITSDTTLPTLGFSTANASLQLTTNHQCDGSQPGANCSAAGAPTDMYSFNLEVEPGLEVPVAATLLSGDQMQPLVPLDLGVQFNYNVRNRLGVRFMQPSSSYAPLVGNTLDVLVTYSDGSSEVLHASVTSIMGFPILSAPTGNPVQFSWTNPTGATNGELAVYPPGSFGNPIWGVALARPPQTALTYAGPPLTTGQSYVWWLYTFDSAGNQGATAMAFTAP